MGRLSTQVQNPATERPAGGLVFDLWRRDEAGGFISPHQTHQKSDIVIPALKRCGYAFRSIVAACLLPVCPSAEKGEFDHA
jgi:hypothetical protein